MASFNNIVVFVASVRVLLTNTEAWGKTVSYDLTNDGRPVRAMTINDGIPDPIRCSGPENE